MKTIPLKTADRRGRTIIWTTNILFSSFRGLVVFKAAMKALGHSLKNGINRRVKTCDDNTVCYAKTAKVDPETSPPSTH